MTNSARIIYAGTPAFALPPLQCLVEAGATVCAVYTQPDRKAGRGRKLSASPVKQWAEERGLNVQQPETLNSESEQQILASYQADLMVVTAYGLILPSAVLSIPAHGCVNLHASILPRWRGAAPIQRAILAGDEISGITLMQMNEGLDTGRILAAKTLSIAPWETSAELHDRLANLGAHLLLEALPDLLAGRLPGEDQDDTQASYAKKIAKQEAQIDWGKSAQDIARQICAFNAWPVAQTVWKDKNLRIWRAEVTNGVYGNADTPGTVLSSSSDGIDVICGEGVLRILELQLPGARALSCADFVNAYDLTGEILG